MMRSGNYQFNLWWEKNGEEFVSHATRHREVLKEGTLRSAEEVYRLKGEVEHETGLAYRTTSSYFNSLGSNAYQVLIYNTQHSPDEEVDYKKCWAIPEFALDSGILTKLQTRKDIKIEDRGLYTNVYFEKGDEYGGGTMCYEMDFDQQRDEATQACAPGKLDSFYPFRPETLIDSKQKAISIVADEQNKRKVDQSLRAIYDDLLRDNACPSRSAYTLFSMRQRIFLNSSHRLASEIRVEKNGIRWFYGDVAILVGNPRGYLAWEGEYNSPYSTNQEFFLREPFQVGDDEGFHHITLKDPSVIIVARDAETIKSLPAIDPEIKGKIVDLETLTNDQQTRLKK